MRIGMEAMILILTFFLSIPTAHAVGEPIAPDIVDSFEKIQEHLVLGNGNQQNIIYKLDQLLQEVRHSKLEDQVEELRKRIHQLENNQDKPSYVETQTGIVYYRWGRISCPGNGTTTIYDGFASGGDHTHSGASPEMLCLPRDPEWGLYRDTTDVESNLVYIAEYELPDGRDHTIFGKSVHQQDIPCAVCETRNRKLLLIIPGRKTCYDGWSREYWGYLMSSKYTHIQQKNFYCIDADPEFLLGGGANTNGFILYFVEMRKGGNIFPPYVEGRELPCVVCTK